MLPPYTGDLSSDTDARTLQDITEKLAIECPKAVIAKAAELYRLSTSRNAARTLGKHQNLLGCLCLHLAAEMNDDIFSHNLVAQAFTIPPTSYLSSLSKLRSVLNIPAPPITFQSLAVRLGATQIVDTAHSMLEAFKDHYGNSLSEIQKRRMDWGNPDLVVAVFYSCLRCVSKVGKRELSSLAPNQTQFNAFVKLVEDHCTEELEHLKNSANTSATPKRSNSQTPSGKVSTGKRKRKVAEVSEDEDLNADGQPGEEPQLTEGTMEPGTDQDHMENTPVQTPRRRTRTPKRQQEAPQAVTPTPRKRPRLGASATPLPKTPKKLNGKSIEADLAVSGINSMVANRCYRESKKYVDYLQWRAALLKSLPDDSLRKARELSS
ncbi:hypothetical protein HDU85_006931 [Gaertneriomyces sp. JEL0708]|nr:hypothetical protein HDU85_006931 [Gaertneriomyces sp. JEL0708]